MEAACSTQLASCDSPSVSTSRSFKERTSTSAGSLPSYNLVNSLYGDTEMFGETDLRQIKRLEKLHLEDLSWIGWDTVLGQHRCASHPRWYSTI